MIPTSSQSSDSSNWNQVNDLMRQFQSDQTTRIIKDETGTRRVLLGKGANGFYGLKVSDPNVDVFEATNDQLIFNSEQNVFKIVGTGTLTSDAYNVTTGAGTYDAGNSPDKSVAHGLTYTPGLLAFVQIGTLFIPTPYSFWANVGTTGFTLSEVVCSVDATNVYLSHRTMALNKTVAVPIPSVTVRYYLLQETAN